jgi:hypothetical protein
MWRSLRDRILWVLTGWLIAFLERGIKMLDLIREGRRRLLARGTAGRPWLGRIVSIPWPGKPMRNIPQDTLGT